MIPRLAEQLNVHPEALRTGSVRPRPISAGVTIGRRHQCWRRTGSWPGFEETGAVDLYRRRHRSTINTAAAVTEPFYRVITDIVANPVNVLTQLWMCNGFPARARCASPKASF